MKELTLDGCGITLDLETFKLLAKGHPSHNAWSMVSQEYGSINWNHTPGTMQSSFTLSLKNTDFSEKAIENLRRSGRVLNPEALKQELDFSQGPAATHLEQKLHMRHAENLYGRDKWEDQVEYANQRINHAESKVDKKYGIIQPGRLDLMERGRSSRGKNYAQSTAYHKTDWQYTDGNSKEVDKSKENVKKISKNQDKTTRDNKNSFCGFGSGFLNKKPSQDQKLPGATEKVSKNAAKESAKESIGSKKSIKQEELTMATQKVSKTIEKTDKSKDETGNKKPSQEKKLNKKEPTDELETKKAKPKGEYGNQKTHKKNGNAKKRGKKSPKPTSLTPFGSTVTSRELIAKEVDWLFCLQTKLENGKQLTLKDVLNTFPLNKLYYQTDTGASALKSNGNVKPAYTGSNMALITMLQNCGFNFTTKKSTQVGQVNADTKTPGTVKPPDSKGYLEFMKRIIAKPLKEEAKEKRKDAKKVKLVQALKKEKEKTEKAQKGKSCPENPRTDENDNKFQESVRKFQEKVNVKIVDLDDDTDPRSIDPREHYDCGCDCFCTLVGKSCAHDEDTDVFMFVHG